MAPMKSKSAEPQKKRINSRQHAFLKAYAKGKTLKEAALQAGYSPKNAAQSGFQALKGVQSRIPELMDEVGLSDRVLIEKYLKPLLEAEETKFFAIRNRLVSRNVIAHGIRHTALDTAFKLRGSYAPRNPKEAEQFGIKVVVVDIPRPPRNAIDVTPGGAGGNGTPPTDNAGND
jgi:hypothetical protein